MSKEELWRRQGYHPFPVQPHDLVTIPGLKDLRVEVLPAYHRCMSVGFGLSSVKRKLRQKFHQAKKEDIIAARKNIYKSCREDYRSYIDSILQEIEKADRKGNTRALSKLTKSLTKQHNSTVMPSKKRRKL